MRKLASKSARFVRNLLLDIRYGAFLGGTRKSPYAHLGVQDTANTDYGVLPLIFRDVIQDSDVLVDIGSGKGRVINWWLSRGLRNSIFGIELDKRVASAAQRRLRRYTNVKIICGDAISKLPANGTIFYIYNPFSRPWVTALKDALAPIFARGGSRILFYYNCIHVCAFKEDPAWKVEERCFRDSNFHPLAVITMRNVGADGAVVAKSTPTSPGAATPGS